MEKLNTKKGVRHRKWRKKTSERAFRTCGSYRQNRFIYWQRFSFSLVLAYSLRNYLFEFPYKNSFHSPSFISIYLLTKQMKMWQQNFRCAHVCTAEHIFEILRKSIENWQIGSQPGWNEMNKMIKKPTTKEFRFQPYIFSWFKFFCHSIEKNE